MHTRYNQYLRGIAMKDLKGHIGTKKDAKKTSSAKAQDIRVENGKAPEGVSLSDFDPSDVNMVKGLSDKYKDNAPQLVSDILSAAQKEKANGTLNRDALEQFSRTVAPMLNGQQRMLLDEILKAILN